MPKTLFDFGPEPAIRVTDISQQPPKPEPVKVPVKKTCPKCGSDRIAESSEKHTRKSVKNGKVQTVPVEIVYKFCLGCRNKWSSEEED